MLLEAMVEMVLAAAAPAFAQANATDEGDDVEYNAVCQNILGSVGDIIQDQDASASASAVDDSAAAAAVAQEQGVTIEQVNECLNEADFDDDGFIEVVELEEFGVVFFEDDGSVSATVETETLPETGGAPLLALGAGALLVAGGLVARRIFR